MNKILDYWLEVSKLELQSRTYVQHQTNILGKGIKPLYLLNSVLKSTVTVILQSGLGIEINHEGWYATKQRNQTNQVRLFIY